MKLLKLLKPTLFLFGALSALQGMSQTTINVTGNSAVIHGMTFDYSIGEMTLVSTAKSANLIVTQGLLQPQASTGSSNTTDSDNQHISSMAGMINVYPNPTSHVLYIETKDRSALPPMPTFSVVKSA